MMKTLLLSFVLALSTSAFAKSEKWVIDNAHTKIGFEISHLVISSVEGKFKDFSGELTFDPDSSNQKASVFETTIQAKSIDTDNEKRDNHLRSPDFFNVKKHKTVHFKSTKISMSGKKVKVTGKLTIAGVTKDVVLKGKFLGKANAYDVTRVAFKLEGSISRKAFGLRWNDVVEVGPVVGDLVELSIKMQAKRKADL